MHEKTRMNFVIWMYKLGNGGAERVVADLASCFAKKNNITILTYTDEGDYKASLDENVKIQNLGARLPRFLKPRTLFCISGLVQFIRKNKPDIVFTTGLQHSVILLFLCRFFRFSSKIVIRETNTISVQSRKSQNSFNRFRLWAARQSYPLANKIIAPSQGVAKDLKTHIPEISHKIEIIPNPIDFETIQTKALEPLPKHINIKNPYILAVGRLVPQKGHLDLIKAWAPLYQKRGIKLIILGEGSERKNLIKHATECGVEANLHLPGFDVNPFHYMKHCAVFVLSSYYEGLPNALLQALACGCRVVATDCPSGSREILQDGQLGELVSVGDIQGIRDAIERQFDNTENDIRAKQNAIQTLYDKEKISERYLNVFKTA